MKTLKISIINSYPANSGDLALLEATIYSIKEKYRNSEISVFCNPLNSEVLGNYGIFYSYDYEYLVIEDNYRFTNLLKKIIVRVFGKVALIKSNILKNKRQKEYIRIIKDSDIVLSSAGSYLNDLYNNDLRFTVLELITNEFLKKVVLFSQSVGPFRHAKNRTRFNEIAANCFKVILRENISKSYVQQNIAKVYPDIFFVLFRKYAEYFNHDDLVSPKKLRIVLSFRDWPDISEEKIAELVQYLSGKDDIELYFLSTCQGVKNYRDDSLFFKKIAQKYSLNVAILEGYHTPKEFIEIVSNYDAFIGMRLHGALLSLICGIPAFVISYEHKSKGIYEMLGYSDYEINFKSEVTDWIESIDKYLGSLANIKSTLKVKMDKFAKLSFDNIEEIFNG